MFETNQQSDEGTKSPFPNPSYIQRSVSAPAISEHVSDGMIQNYQFY